MNMVNERTRQVENVQALMKLQEKIENTAVGYRYFFAHLLIILST